MNFETTADLFFGYFELVQGDQRNWKEKQRLKKIGMHREPLFGKYVANVGQLHSHINSLCLSSDFVSKALLCLLAQDHPKEKGRAGLIVLLQRGAQVWRDWGSTWQHLTL